MPLRKKTFRPSIWARILMLESWKVTLGRPSDGGISISSTADRSIQALDIIDIRVSKAILWSVLEVRSARSVERLSGLTAAGAEDLDDGLLINEAIGEPGFRGCDHSGLRGAGLPGHVMFLSH